MPEYESEIEIGGESDRYSEPTSDGKRKWVVYRLNEETYVRLLAKRQRGEKINFKERGGDHQFTSATRKPTPERIRDESGSGYFIIEHLVDNRISDYSFVRSAPAVTEIASEQLVAPRSSSSPPALLDPNLQVILERLESLELRGRALPRDMNRVRSRLRNAAPRENSDRLQIELVLQLQREAAERERSMWQQLLESARATQSANNSSLTAPDNPYALFAPLAATNPTLAEKLLERAFPEEEKSTWMADVLKHPQETLQLLQAGLGLFIPGQNGSPSIGNSTSPGSESVNGQPQGAIATESEAMRLVVFTLIDDVQHNRRVGRVADLIEESCRRFPSLLPHVTQILTADNAGVFQMIQASTSVDLSAFAHAGDFFDDLREELEESLVPASSEEQSAGPAAPTAAAAAAA
jgi:hypothetical protein